MTQKFKAWQLTKFGPEESNLELKELEMPLPGPNDVRVRVLATSINPVEYKMRAANWWGAQLPWILGTDVAGVVDAVGSNVTKVKPGDEVMYCAQLVPHLMTGYTFKGGSFAEYNMVEAPLIVPKPPSLTFAEAASLPLVGMTASDLISRTSVRAGENVLVCGGSGGVGAVVVQMAKANGAFVVATSGANAVDVVKGLGADVVIDYKTDWVAAAKAALKGDAFDVIIDCAGGENIANAASLAKYSGRAASCASVTGNLQTAMTKNLTLSLIWADRKGEKVATIANYVNRGFIKPAIDRVFPFSELPQAMTLSAKGSLKGKVVVAVSDDANKKTLKQ